MKQIDAESGEFLYLSVLVKTVEADKGFKFTYLRSDEFEISDCDRYELLRAGAKAGAKEVGVTDLEVAIVDLKLLNVDSPHWLFEHVAKACVVNAIKNPDETISYSGNRRQALRWKEKYDTNLRVAGYLP